MGRKDSAKASKPFSDKMEFRMKRARFFFALILLFSMATLIPHDDAFAQRDDRFGSAFRSVVNNQTLNPRRSRNRNPVYGMDGQAARISIEKYRKSFEKEKPPSTVLIPVAGMEGGG